MTTALSLILALMLSIGGSSAGGPGNTGIQATVDNSPNVSHFFEGYTPKTASRLFPKKIPEIVSIDQPKTQIRLIFTPPLKEKPLLMGYEDSMNLYQAFNMNPINFTDPFGLTQVEPSIWPCYLAAKQYNPAIANIYERVSTAAMMAIGGGVTAKIMGIKFAISALLTLNITSTFDETVERRNAGQTPEQVNRAAAARLLMFGPFYKTFTGKDFGTQERVSIEDRVATAGEIIMGTFGFIFGYEAGPKTSGGFLDFESVTGTTLSSGQIRMGNLPELPEGYFYRKLGDKIQVVRKQGSTLDLPQLHLDNGVLKIGPSPKIARSTSIRSDFLKQLDPNYYPKWMWPYLEKGEVPPGFVVDHIKALFDGGLDLIENMILKPIDIHIIRHKFYRPGGQIPTINPKKSN